MNSVHPRTHQAQEHLSSGGCSSLVLFIIIPRGNPPPPHWSRVLHHNGGLNQYKPRVFLCCEFVEFARKILAS